MLPEHERSEVIKWCKYQMNEQLKHAGSFVWNIELMAYCPHCEEFVDVEEDLLTDYDVCEPAKDIERECPECKKWFRFDVEGGR